jgi:hypothetical protein
MATTDHPITTPPGLRRIGLDPAPVNLFLHAGWWQAACPSCGHVLCEGRRQDRVERKAARTSCPICQAGSALAPGRPQ